MATGGSGQGNSTSSSLPDDQVDNNTFAQILEMDEEDDHEFSRGIVEGFFEQAKETFDKMDKALEATDLKTLSELGHFLKGSSAALGLVKVQASCEKIQRYGKMEDDEGKTILEKKDALDRIKKALEEVKTDYAEVEKALRNFYGTEENAPN